jgi:hypothetical protein
VLAIRHEVDRVVDPHWQMIDGAIVCQALRSVGGEIVDPYIRRAAAAITFPGSEIIIDWCVDKLAAIR